MRKNKKKVEGEYSLPIGNVKIRDGEVELAIKLLNDYGYTKTTLVTEGVKALAKKEWGYKDDESNP